MLYAMHDARHRALEPLRLTAELTRITFANPFLPVSYTPFGRSVAAGADLLGDLLKTRDKPAWGLDDTTVDGETVPVSIVVQKRKTFCDLIRFERAGRGADQPKILLVAPMSGHHATLLRGTVEALIPDHNVYVTDWKDARDIPLSEGSFGLDEYIAYLIEFIRDLGPDVAVMAVCQPAPAVLAAVSLMAEDDDPAQPKSMILMGGPIDTRANPTIVTRAAENRTMGWFENNVVHPVPARYAGANRMVYPGFLQINAFMAMNPARHVSAHWKMFEHLVRGDGESADAHRAFYDEYLSVMDTTAEFYLETVRHIFKEHAIPLGTFKVGDRLVDAAAVRKTALLTVEGELDDISAPGQTVAAHDICASIPKARRGHLLQEKVGHYGIFNGRRWRESIKPRIAAFIRANL